MTDAPRQRRPLLSMRDAAAYVGVDERYLRRMWAERRIVGVKLGSSRNSKVVFDPDDLDTYIEARKVRSPSALAARRLRRAAGN